MARIRSTILLSLLAAGGCTGQNVEGLWTGPLPLEGTRECRIRLLEDRAATVQCDGTSVVGGGHYAWDGSRLTLTLSVLTYDGHKVRAPEPLTFEVQGRGNEMSAVCNGVTYRWARTMR